MALIYMQLFDTLAAISTAFDLPSIAVSLALILVPLALLKLEGVKNFRKELLLQKFDFKKTFLEGLKLTTIMFALLIVINVILHAAGLLDNQGVMKLVSTQAAQAPLALILSVVILAPIAEELFFRGYLLKRIGVVPQAVLFTVLHFGYGSVSEVFTTLAMGIVFGLYVQKNKELYSPLFAHGLYNLLVVAAVVLIA